LLCKNGCDFVRTSKKTRLFAFSKRPRFFLAFLVSLVFTSQIGWGFVRTSKKTRLFAFSKRPRFFLAFLVSLVFTSQIGWGFVRISKKARLFAFSKRPRFFLPSALVFTSQIGGALFCDTPQNGSNYRGKFLVPLFSKSGGFSEKR